MTLRWWTLALLLSPGVVLAENPLSGPRVYVSKEGLRAVVATLKGDQCVLMVDGTKTEFDGLVLDCRAERVDAQTTYFVTRRGREERAMRSKGDGALQLSGWSNPLDFSDAESKKENLEALWAKHQAQAASGQLAVITKFDRAAEAAAASKEVASETEKVNQRCGTRLTVTLDWSSAPDENFKSTRPQEGCLRMMSTMGEMCERWKVVRSTFAERLSEVRCTFGDREPAFTLEGKTLTLSSNHETVSVSGAFDRYIREAL